MNDLVFRGGMFGLNVGNQQFTMRNLTFYNCRTAVNMFWDWGWTYKGLNVNNCTVGLDMSNGGVTSVAAVIVLDSVFNDVKLAINTSRTAVSTPNAAGVLVVENVQLNNVGVAIANPTGTLLAGTAGSSTIAAWAEGHEYNPTGYVSRASSPSNRCSPPTHADPRTSPVSSAPTRALLPS